MSKVLKVVLGLAVLYVVLMGGSGLAIRAMLSGQTGERIRAAAQETLPVDVSISGGSFDIAKWFVFQPSLSFENLRVANAPGYSNEPLLSAALVSADAALGSLLGEELEIARIEIVEPALLIEANERGVTNIDALLAALSAPDGGDEEPAEPSDGRSLVIGGFSIRDGSIRYVTPGEQPMVVKNLSVQVEDFSPASSFSVSASLDLFEEEAVHLAFDGDTGPFNPQSAPAQGALSVDAALSRLPEQFRVDNLGDFIVSPGAESRLTLQSDLAGDLLDDFSGNGRIQFEDIQLGKADKPQLPLRGEAPISLTIRNALANPSWMLKMPDAELQLGAGVWRGSIDLTQGDDRIAGRSNGSIQGVDVNELLTALTDSENVVFGLLELDSYDLQFSGRDSTEIQDSFQGKGRLDLLDGKLAVFDTLKTVEQKVNKVLKGEQSYAEGVTSFVRAGTDFVIADRRVTTPNLLLENESASLGGAGSFGFDLDLDYDISSLISGPLADALGGEKNTEGVAQLAAPLRVTGTVDSPKVFLDVKGLAKKAAADKAKSLLGGLLGGKSSEQETPPAAEGEEQQPEKAKKLPFGLGGVVDKALGEKKE